MDNYPIATPISWQCTAADDLERIVQGLHQALETVRSIADRVHSVTALDWYSPAGSKFREYVEEQRRQLMTTADSLHNAISEAKAHSIETARLRLLEASGR